MSQDRIAILNSVKPHQDDSRWEDHGQIIREILPFTVSAMSDAITAGIDLYHSVSESALPTHAIPYMQHLIDSGVARPAFDDDDPEWDAASYFTWFLPFHIHRGFGEDLHWYSEDSECMNPELLFQLEDWIKENPADHARLLGAYCMTNTYASLVELDGVEYDVDWTHEEFFEKGDFSSVTGMAYYASLVPAHLKPIIEWIFEVACHDD